eukprot:TRINITY_DN7660_c0_g1_i1.p1 TRINITY_DN7660_c0_g1~~TRINITY_DN7660_c0_g1_i1.p1  ORF type:complete len:383 (+),score=52.50 TRINITY_DN7660_c0_g1_i1:76-1149(+)
MKAFLFEDGLTPAVHTVKTLSRKRPGFLAFPSIFRFCHTDLFLYSMALLASLSSGLVGVGIVVWPFSLPLIFCVSVIWYSFWCIAQPWLGLQMHVNIIELNFIYLVGGIFFPWNSSLITCLMRLFVWRKMFSCGVGKLVSFDESWRDLTAMDYHYWTQPLPNPLSYYFHFFPKIFHKFEVICTHIIEVPLPFLVFGPWICRLVACIGIVSLNFLINITGNFGFLGIMSMVECIYILDDATWFYLLQPVIGFFSFQNPFHVLPYRYLLEPQLVVGGGGGGEDPNNNTHLAFTSDDASLSVVSWVTIFPTLMWLVSWSYFFFYLCISWVVLRKYVYTPTRSRFHKNFRSLSNVISSPPK